jgi:hypothetical protein
VNAPLTVVQLHDVWLPDLGRQLQSSGEQLGTTQDQLSPAELMKSSQYSVAESHIKLGPHANGCPASTLASTPFGASLAPSGPPSLTLPPSVPLASSLLELLSPGPSALASVPPLLPDELPELLLLLDDDAPVSTPSLDS